MDSGRVARAVSERGEIVLTRRSGDGALELRVNGVFVMDTVHTSTERLLATTTLDAYYAAAHVRSGTAPVRTLIGGLGLGFTLREVLADRRVTRVLVAEIEPALVDWHRRGFVPDTAAAIGDERVELVTGEITDIIAEQVSSSWEAILLDVDNGPGYLVYEANAAVYRRDFLTACHRTLAPHGITAIWSADPAPELDTVMREVFAAVEELTIPVTLGGHPTTYHLYVGRRGGR
ncbi:spermidine synthase [Haloactinomyces albus]|uniref:Spermidine synthase n=1 Tax=Haloactinomyces albus TaxID=1352928 RepID=A0AAE4CM75_9ACTN|nr:hypothetical protein [Haloactinomyces albus]MDR7303040.1 spermidine synthase [Haloactinomyces albus]